MKRKMQNNRKFLILLVLLSFTWFLNAEKIVFSASSMTGKTGDSSSTTSLKGDAYILTESIEIRAESIELSGEDYRYIKAEGGISGKNLESEMEFHCDSLEYDRITKLAVLNGNVTLVDIENDVRASAQRIEYNQENDIAVLQIGVSLTQKENVCSGAYAVYHKKEQLLEISGNAQVRQGEDVFRAQNIIFDMDTEDITLGGNVKGSVKDNKKEEKKQTEMPVEETSEKENIDNTENVEEEAPEDESRE